MPSLAQYPKCRLRRLRDSEHIRNMMRETHLGPEHLILPIFVRDGKGLPEQINSMPSVMRQTTESLPKLCEEALKSGIHSIALFPVIESNLKDESGKESYNPKGLVQCCIADIKRLFPELLVISDVALDPYTSHGQDGITDKSGYVLNDETISVFKKQALSHAQAGADIIAPSDMMDGRIGVIRDSFEENKFTNTKILAYAAKYASVLYGPFREAVDSAKFLATGDKRTYQMDPGNSDEAINEARLDLQEGADILMVKPGLPYLDILYRIKSELRKPTFIYQVSGEYAMIKAASQNGWIDEKTTVLECLLSMRRAGASAILSYYALDAAKWIRNS